MKKNNKRIMATDCKLVRASNSNPGYFRYDVTIEEKDGTIHTQPCYGVDMQDAISRLINKERTIKIEKKLTATNPFLIFLLWMVVMGWPAIMTTTHDSPIFLAYSFLGIIVLLIAAWRWYNYVNKE